MFRKNHQEGGRGNQRERLFPKNSAEVYRGEDSWKLEVIYCLETRIYLQSKDFTMNFTPSIDV